MHSLSRNNFTEKWHVSPGITNSSLGHIQLILILISAVSTVCNYVEVLLKSSTYPLQKEYISYMQTFELTKMEEAML